MTTDASADSRLKVVDTYIRAVEKLSRLVPEVDALEAEVAGREAELLKKILALLVPILPRLVAPISFNEPWLDGKEKGTPRALKEPGVLVDQTFSHHREEAGRHVHRSLSIVIDARGRLLLVHETARWTEPTHADIRWDIEASEAEVTPALAREHLPNILAGVLDVLRRRLARDLDDKRELKERLDRLAEAERALG